VGIVINFCIHQFKEIMFGKTIQDFVSFLKKPHPIQENKTINTKSLTQLFYLFLITYLFKTTWLLTVNKYLRSIYDVKRSEIADTSEQSIWIFFLLAVFVYPVVEEFIFRYYLKSKKVISLIVVCLFVFLTAYWMAKGFNYPSLLIKRVSLIVSSLLPVILIIWYYIKQKKDGRLDKMFSKFYFIPFYVSVVAFSLLHGFNFDFSNNNILVIPFLIPFLFSGMTYAYTRVKFGMWANLSLHISFNLTTFILDKGLGI
jgi:hypothetical protein